MSARRQGHVGGGACKPFNTVRCFPNRCGVRAGDAAGRDVRNSGLRHFIGAAAVADFRPVVSQAHKIKSPVRNRWS